MAVWSKDQQKRRPKHLRASTEGGQASPVKENTLRKALSVSACVVFLCLWVVVVLAVSMPDRMQDLWTDVRGLFGESQEVYTIEDASIPLGGPVSSNGVQQNGQLQVRDGQLVNEAGEPLQLRGMSSHGLAWYSEYTDIRAIQTTKQYGANLFRIAMYVDDDPGNYTLDEKDQETNKRLLYDAIDSTLALDMYAIADWHVLKDGNPLNRLDCAIAFFDELSKKYADNPGVLYEICNEPNGGTTWADIAEYASHIVPTIRANAPDALIIVGTPNYCSDLAPAMAAPLPYDNVMYAYHYYSGAQKDTYEQAMTSALEMRFPIFVSEWGFGDPDEPEVFEERYGTRFLTYLKENRISWANWSLSNKEESHSAILPEVTKLSGWVGDDLSASGKIVFAALHGG